MIFPPYFILNERKVKKERLLRLCPVGYPALGDGESRKIDKKKRKVERIEWQLI